MSKDHSSNKFGVLLLPCALLIGAAALCLCVLWSAGRDAERAEEQDRALAGIRHQLTETEDRLQKTQDELAQTKKDLSSTREEMEKLASGTGYPPELNNRVTGEPLGIITKRKFTETDFDETLKRASFKTPEIEARLMTEKPVILLEDEAETPPAPAPVEKATGLNAGGKYERDALEMAASEALGKAIAYEYNNPNAKKEDIALRYREVISKYPDTTASKEAAKILKEILKRDK